MPSSAVSLILAARTGLIFMGSAFSNSSERRLALLESLLRNAVDAIVTIDTAGIILSANPATERLFGYRPDEVIGFNVGVLLPESEQREHDWFLDRFLRTGEAHILGLSREVQGRRKDGTIFPVHLAVSESVVDGDRFFTGILRDISDVKATESRLEELSHDLERQVQSRSEELRQTQVELSHEEKFAAMGRVSGGIAHEIRNPLNVLKSSAYFLLNATEVSEAKRQEHLRRIERQVAVIDTIVSALSATSRMRDAERQETDLIWLIKTLITKEAFPATIRFQFDHASDLPPVMVDSAQMQIVFRNLFRNAIEAMSHEGTITVRIAAEDHGLTLVIEDEGMGIENELLGRIMEPFYSTKSRGMGLGLPLCRLILEKNGGEIEIDSQVGKGTTVKILLPTTGG
ncbi:PAS domain S-box protein [Roseiconus lacunae]|nr:PAS domain S-box protein [Roseiconus lacunae]